MSDIGINQIDHHSWRLSLADMQRLLCDIDSALTDYANLAQHDTSAFDKGTVSQYLHALGGLRDNLSLDKVADLTAQMPSMLSAIQQYIYPQSTLDPDPPLLDSKGKGKGKERASARAAAGRGTSGDLSDSFDAARSYACLIRMLKLRQARQDAFKELLQGDRTDLEGFFESDQPDQPLPPAIILRSIKRGQTSLTLDGKDMGCLFTTSHADEINDIKNSCDVWDKSMAGGSPSPDMWPMEAWKSDLFNLFDRALVTPDDEFEVLEDIDSEYESGDVPTGAQTQEHSDWVPDGASPADIEAMFALMEAQHDKQDHTSRR